MKGRKFYTTFALFATLTLAMVAFAPRAQAAPYCLTDGFGYVWSLNVTPAGGNVFNFSGTVANAYPSPGIVSGTYNRTTNTIILTATNPSPDGCATYSGSFTYTGSRSGASISFSWTNDCGGSGTGTGSVSAGSCRVGNFGVSSEGPGIAMRSSASVLSITPNPASDIIALTYVLDQTQDMTIEVMDISGRTVTTLAQGVQDAGTYSVSWNLTASNGVTLPNGLYLVRFNDKTERLMIQR